MFLVVVTRRVDMSLQDNQLNAVTCCSLKNRTPVCPCLTMLTRRYATRVVEVTSTQCRKYSIGSQVPEDFVYFPL